MVGPRQFSGLVPIRHEPASFGATPNRTSTSLRGPGPLYGYQCLRAQGLPIIESVVRAPADGVECEACHLSDGIWASPNRSRGQNLSSK
jgi:hypothetical protein